MNLKNRVIVIALLTLLALSITPIRKNNEQASPQATAQHPKSEVQTKSSTSKDAKVAETDKHANAKASSQKKEVRPVAQTKKTEEVAGKDAAKSSVKPKEKHEVGKKLQKKVEKSTKTGQKQDEQTIQSQQDKQAPKKLTAQNTTGHNFWALIIMYCIILAALGYGAKYVYFPHSNNAFQLLLDVIIKIKEFKLGGRKQGYRAPEYHQEVDDSNSITVGYTQDHAKQLFWQKNSVEGI